MKGLVGHGAPVIRLRRRVLPPRERLFSGLVPIAASPVPTSREPFRSISRRQPPWRPELVGKPPISCLILVALRSFGSSRHAMTRTSCPPPLVVPPWQV